MPVPRISFTSSVFSKRPCMQQPACLVWFFNPEHQAVTGLDVINHFVAYCDPPYCHTEVQFASGEACSIVFGKTVQMRRRKFDERYYTGLRVTATAAQLQAAREIANRLHQEKVPFGVFSPGATYCSRLVADILLGSGVVRDEDGAMGGRISPSGLWKALQKLPQVQLLRPQVVSAIDFKDV